MRDSKLKFFSYIVESPADQLAHSAVDMILASDTLWSGTHKLIYSLNFKHVKL